MLQQILLMRDCSLVTFCRREIRNALNHMGAHRKFENISLWREFRSLRLSLSQGSIISHGQTKHSVKLYFTSQHAYNRTQLNLRI